MANPGAELASLDFGNLIGGPLVAVIKAQSLAADATARFIKETGFYPADFPTPSGGTPLAGTPIYVDFKYPKEVQPYEAGKAFYKISSITIDNGGSGYAATATPVLSTPAAGETSAVLGAVAVDTQGTVTGITVTSGGVYLTPPTITMPAPTGTSGTPAQISVSMALDHVESAKPAVFQEMKISVPILTMLPIPFIKVDIVTIDFNAKITTTDTSTSSSDLSASGTVNAGYGGKRAYVNFSGTVAYKRSTASGSSVERTYSMAIHVQASQDEMPAGMEKLLGILESAMISTPSAILPAPAH